MKETRRTRGLAYQRWCKVWLEENHPGCVVHNQPMNHFRLPSGIWVCRSNDILGCVDLVAIIPGCKPLFIQCSLHQKVEERLNDFKKIPWPLEYCDVQLWLKKPDGSTVIKEYTGESLVDKSRIVRRKLCPMDSATNP